MKNDVLNSRFVEYTLICGCPLISSGSNGTFFYNNGARETQRVQLPIIIKKFWITIAV